MLASVRTAAVFGIEAVAVSVEVDVSFGLPGLVMVGLPDATVRESRDRVRSAIRNSGFAFPQHRVTVNLAPADVRKAGAAFDLPIALGVLAATGIVTTRAITDALLVGELSLDGSMQPTRGVLPIAASARRNGCHRLLLPSANAAEASIVEGLRVLPVNCLQEAVDVLNDAVEPRAVVRPQRETASLDEPDLADVQGQALGRRALEVAAAGGHNLLLVGPPGAGKSMLAARLPGILPPLTSAEALVVTRLHSAAGLRPPGRGLVRERPFRAPHHSVSRAGLIGGGTPPKPGELSLAHHGVLFMDELSLVPRSLLDALREPLESGEVTHARASGVRSFPARALLAAAMNPCPCGWLGHPKRGCRCTPTDLTRHMARVSGPVLDRLDLQIEVPALTAAELLEAGSSEPSAAVRARVLAARERQQSRGALNARLTSTELRACAALDGAGRRLVADAVDRGGMSARGVHRAIRVARTIADLAGEERVTAMRLAEALQYRAYEARRLGVR